MSTVPEPIKSLIFKSKLSAPAALNQISVVRSNLEIRYELGGLPAINLS